MYTYVKRESWRKGGRVGRRGGEEGKTRRGGEGLYVNSKDDSPNVTFM